MHRLYVDKPQNSSCEVAKCLHWYKIHLNGSFILTEMDSDMDHDLDSKLNGYIVLMQHIAQTGT